LCGSLERDWLIICIFVHLFLYNYLFYISIMFSIFQLCFLYFSILLPLQDIVKKYTFHRKLERLFTRRLSSWISSNLKYSFSVISLLMHDKSIQCTSQTFTKKLRKFSVYYVSNIVNVQCFLSSARDARHVGYYDKCC